MVPVRALSDGAYRCDLGDGLVVRWATAGDADRLTQFFSLVYRDAPDEPPLSLPAAFARDLLSGYHQLIGPTDFAVVEDTRNGALAATNCLLSQV